MDYYNDFDPNACAWARELIDMGLAPEGYIDGRSIIEIDAAELAGYRRLHFFAGILGWPLALERAGWPEQWPVCSASLPCQSFSSAGKRKGKDDERHLLPCFLELVRGLRPGVLLGEQVAAAIKCGWLDDLAGGLEREGYTVRATVLTAAGAGQAHIRQRLYWCAFLPGGVAHPDCQRREPRQDKRPAGLFGADVPEGERRHEPCGVGAAFGGLGDTQCPERRAPDKRGATIDRQAGERDEGADCAGEPGTFAQLDDIDWLPCRDGKWRPVPGGLDPLVWAAKPAPLGLSYGLPGRMVRGGGPGEAADGIDPRATGEARNMRLKGYGNAIDVATATLFISAALGLLRGTQFTSIEEADQ